MFCSNLGIWPLECHLLFGNSFWRNTIIYFCGYFISSKGPNWENICILLIFGVYFSQNVGSWPRGVTLYSANTCCLAIYLEEILLYFAPNIFCGYFISPNGPNWEVIYIIPKNFDPNLGVWPPGVAINFEEIRSCFVLNVFSSYFVLSKCPNWEVICIIPIF